MVKRRNVQTLREAEEIARERAEALFNAKVNDLSGNGNRDILLSDWLQICRDSHEM